MPAFAAWKSETEYSVVLADDEPAVWRLAKDQGVKLFRVTALKLKNRRVVCVGKLT